MLLNILMLILHLKVYSSLVDGFETIDHNYPMLSLGNTYSEEDLFDFDTRTKNY